MLRQGLLLTRRVVLGLLAFLLAVGRVRLLHRKERRTELFVVQRTQVLQLTRELRKVLVLQCVLFSYPLLVVVCQQLMQDVTQIVGTPRRQKLL